LGTDVLSLFFIKRKRKLANQIGDFVSLKWRLLKPNLLGDVNRAAGGRCGSGANFYAKEPKEAR
jgi:hypothetical protein